MEQQSTSLVNGVPVVKHRQTERQWGGSGMTMRIKAQKPTLSNMLRVAFAEGRASNLRLMFQLRIGQKYMALPKTSWLAKFNRPAHVEQLLGDLEVFLREWQPREVSREP